MNKMDMVKERRRTVSRRINITVAVLIFVFNMLSLVGCSRTNVSNEKNEKNEKETVSVNVTVEWDEIKTSLEAAKLTDLYFDNSALEEDIKEFNAISFANYDLTDLMGFKKVEYQVSITYGTVAKEDGSVYENAAYEFIFVDNNSDKYYSAVYQPDKQLLSSEGEWFLEKKQDQMIENYIDELNAAMSIK